jgi:hypothetical protein
VSAFLKDAFAATVEQLGADDARRVWSAIPLGDKRKRGRPRKTDLSGWDTAILKVYDEIRNDADPKKTLITDTARFFYENNRKEYKQLGDVKSLEHRIRKLLADRSSGRLVLEGTRYKYKSAPRSRGK